MISIKMVHPYPTTPSSPGPRTTFTPTWRQDPSYNLFRCPSTEFPDRVPVVKKDKLRRTGPHPVQTNGGYVTLPERNSFFSLML